MKNFRTLLLLLLTIATVNAAKTDTPESTNQTPGIMEKHIFLLKAVSNSQSLPMGSLILYT